MQQRKRGGLLTTLAILYVIAAVEDILKPLRLEGPTTGLVLFGSRLSGTPNTILGPLMGLFLLVFAAGIWRMRRYSLYLAYAYATYVTLNLVIFTAINPPPPTRGEIIFGVVYSVLALALTWGTVIILTRRKADLT
jgi:hypothetical protein